MFDLAWVREAKDRRRKEMRRPPSGMSLEQTIDAADADAVERTLDLADWETNIIFSSL